MGFLFAGLCALCFVALDVLRKILGARLHAALVAIGVNLGAASVFAVVLALSGKTGCDATFLLVASVEAAGHAVASLLYVRAVTLSPLSLTVPYLGFTPVTSMAVAAAVLGEAPNARGLAGIGLVAVGALTLHLERGARVRDLVAAPLREPGSWRMLAVACIWGSTTSLDKIAIAHGSEALLALWLAVGSSGLLACAWFTGLLAGLGAANVRPQGPRTDLLLATAAAAAAGAVLFQFYAYRHLLVAYVETIKRSGILPSVVIGALYFGEGGLSRRLPAAAAMTLGVSLIVLH